MVVPVDAGDFADRAEPLGQVTVAQPIEHGAQCGESVGGVLQTRVLEHVVEVVFEIGTLDLMRDGLGEEDSALVIVADGRPLKVVDADVVTDTFFADTDFLGRINLFDPRIPQESLDALGSRECTAGVIARMKPHPDDLRLVPTETLDDWWDREPDARWWQISDAE